MRRSFTVVICVMSAVLLFPITASARTLAPDPGPSGGFVENPDKTWTLYGEGSSKPLKVYSAAEHDEFFKLNTELDVEAGATEQHASVVEGSSTKDENAAKSLAERLQTAEDYATEGESIVGDEVASDEIAAGTLPTDDAAISACATTVVCGVSVGVFAIGVTIGTGIDDVLEWPTVPDIPFLSKTEEAIPSTPYIINIKASGNYEPYVKLGYVEPCSSHTENPKVDKLSGYCADIDLKWYWGEEGEYKTSHEPWEEHGTENLGWTWIFEPSNGIRKPDFCPPWTPAEVYCNKSSPYEGGKEKVEVIAWLDGGEIKRPGFPAKDLGKHDHSTAEVGTATPPTPLETPVKPITTVPTKVATWIGHEEEKGEEPLLPGIEGEPIPDPTAPEIPEIKPGEIYKDYLPEIEREGYKHITEHIEPEIDISPKTGPEGVVSVSPAPGTSPSTSTNVDINVNPDDAPTPEERTPIGGPSLPGIKFPNLHLLCTTFPFGVPCWLKNQLEAFSAVSSPPVWTIGSFTISGHTIGPVSIHLSLIEPIMEKIRPWMVLFGTLGIVLFFYKVFTGKSIGGGENPTGTVPDPGSDFGPKEVDDEGYWVGWH